MRTYRCIAYNDEYTTIVEDSGYYKELKWTYLKPQMISRNYDYQIYGDTGEIGYGPSVIQAYANLTLQVLCS